MHCSYPLTTTQGDRFASWENIVSRSQIPWLNLCFWFLLGITVAARETEDNAIIMGGGGKGANKVYYDKWRIHILQWL